MEYIRSTGAWMNEINRQIDDVMVKAGISDWGGWRVSSMDQPRYFQVVGMSENGIVGFVGDSDSGTCEVWCRRHGEEHAVPTVNVEEIAECLDMPLERAAIAVAGMTAVVERGHAALSYYDGWTLVETSEGRLLPGLMTQRGTMVDIDRAERAGRLGLGKAAYTVHRDGDDVWAQPVDGGEPIELEQINTRWGSYVVLPGAEPVTLEVHYAAWAAWSAQEPALGRVGPRESKDVYEWHPTGDFSVCMTDGEDGGVPVVMYQSGEWTTIVSVEDTELVNLVKGGYAYATGISVPAARYLIEADLIRQASQPGMSTSTAPEGLSQELADLTEKIDSITDRFSIQVAYFDGTPYVWTEDESIIRLIEGAGGVVEAATPSGEVWREGLWAIHRSTEEDERVLDEVNRQRGAHPAAASSSLVETS
ncbi:hypothetical protein [Actinomyces naeslundii]|uniref:hypothetical protein n=1 Tax=Actinomyces naeslundii TaxID=1655 RepID=UPI00096F4B93|nr:hypothetical protein [Actinomyces naeslundii]OMG10479.1 hypothetical protein BKH07_06415 [Actinomyces naeslundii]